MIIFECLLEFWNFWWCIGGLLLPSGLSKKLLLCCNLTDSKRMSFSHMSLMLSVCCRWLIASLPAGCLEETGLMETEDMGEMDIDEMPSSSSSRLLVPEQVRLPSRKAGRAPGLRY